jgi:hypothetical protein
MLSEQTKRMFSKIERDAVIDCIPEDNFDDLDESAELASELSQDRAEIAEFFDKK